MPIDHIRYDILVQEALRGMVRGVLAEIVKDKTLPGDHHFYITFDTTADGVKLSDRLRDQYPEEMTIVLQHQFWDLKVTDDVFEVGLSFGGVAERLVVPFDAIKAFADPSVQFTLQFESLVEEPEEADQPPEEQSKGKTERPQAMPSRAEAPTSLPIAAGTTPDQPADKPEKAGAEVVRLDRFRKK